MNPAWTGAESKIWEAETSQRVATRHGDSGMSCQLEAPGSNMATIKGRVERGLS